MYEEKSHSMIYKLLKSLCCTNGWSCGVFWRFDQTNSLLLTMEDAYYEEQMGTVIDNMLLQVHILGNGIVGQTAFTKKHQWIHSDVHCGGQNLFESTDIQDTIEDESETYFQFSSGIQTIAVISVEPQGVVQFGSTRKILERMEFVNQTRKLFREVENEPLSSNTRIDNPSELFESVISSGNSHVSNPKPMFGIGSKSDFGTACSFGNFVQTYRFASDHENQLHMDKTETPCTTTWSSGNSTLTSLQELLPCEMTVLGSQSAVLDIPNGPLDHSTGVTDFNRTSHCSSSSHGTENKIAEILTSPRTFQETMESSDFTTVFPQSSPLDNFPPLFVSSSNGMENFLNSYGVENDLFGCGLIDDLLMPVASEGHMDFSIDSFDSMIVPKQGLFSKLGIEELLEGSLGNSNSFSRTTFEDDSSFVAKRRRIESSSVSGEDFFCGNMNLLQSLYNLDKTNNLERKKGVVTKLEVNSKIEDRYSVNGKGIAISQPNNEESVKVNKKKAKRGTRPRPKDRQLIQDCIAELRELVPNGVKMSIDSLLARTIKHMLFLQSVIKHADKLKQPKQKKEQHLNGHSSRGANGVTWACEFAEKSMLCPLLVEDLSAPGQMLIEMLCEERGFFLEIVDIIRGFGLTILKGVMEIRDKKIWARFVVEAEASRQVTRVDIFMALVQILEPTVVSGINTRSDELNSNFVIDGPTDYSIQQFPTTCQLG